MKEGIVRKVTNEETAVRNDFLEKQNEVCSKLIDDLVKVLKFKNIEIELKKRQYEFQLQENSAEEQLFLQKMSKQYEVLKKQEGFVMARINENIEALDAMNQNSEEEDGEEETEECSGSEEYEEEGDESGQDSSEEGDSEGEEEISEREGSESEASHAAPRGSEAMTRE